MSDRSSGHFVATIFISLLTSALVTVGILYFTGNLRQPSEDSASAGAKPPAPEVKTVETPSLKGLTAETASDVLEARGLRLVVKEERGDNTIAKGQICDQEPLPHSILNTGGAVRVVVSTGINRISVPDVAGKPLEEAKKILTDAGFKIGNITESDKGTPGKVVGTTPEKGSAHNPDTSVDIAYTGTSTVPKVTGMRFSKGKKILTDGGFKIGKIKRRYSDYHDGGVILSQDPKAEATVPPKTEIILTVSAD